MPQGLPVALQTSNKPLGHVAARSRAPSSLVSNRGRKAGSNGELAMEHHPASFIL